LRCAVSRPSRTGVARSFPTGVAPEGGLLAVFPGFDPVVPMAEVKEWHLLGKNGDTRGGEDHLLVTADFVALLDGVTSRGRAVDESLRLAGETPGRWAAETIAGAVAGLEPTCSAETACETLSTALHQGMAELGIDGEAWGWPAAAQTIIFSAARNEIWRIGDALVAVNGTPLPECPTPVDLPATQYRSAVLWALLAAGHSIDDLTQNDPTWQMLLPLLELQHHHRNSRFTGNPFAYGLLDGRKVESRFIEITRVEPGDEVVFCSDGYLSPAPSLAQAEADLATVLAEEPLLISLHLGFRPVSPGMVSFDDRSYLRFIV